ncbi:thioredoxin-like protein [Fomitopsis serialis]|uniref:thioredoxin-like protein n=1 Tax=Fomitopsis serialis TaxID=139415 RepID=UPI0020076C29|nr:thioredoxin-like protein [Neoantrodia serialis]KAH9926988.1 thioredoxin-like protein [Neoantrodia serialis]
MLTSRSLPFILLLAPWLVSAALFPAKTEVKLIDAKGFKKVMNQNVTSVVAFVAPWCGYCQRMAPEYSKAAEALAPMVPLYAVDCDQDSNKRLCSEQGVQGFPTVKLYPRGGRSKPLSYESGERTATNFFYWANRNIPHAVRRLDSVSQISGWTDEHAAKPRALLLSSSKDIPLMWKALGNKYKDTISFGVLQDKSGKQALQLGVEDSPTKDSKVLVYPPESHNFVRFEGTLKYKPLNKYLGSVADGTADFPMPREETQDPFVTADPPASTVALRDATRSGSAISSTTTYVSSVPGTGVGEPEATEAAPDEREADEAPSAIKDTTTVEPSSVPEAAAATGPEVEEGVRSDHPKDEL